MKPMTLLVLAGAVSAGVHAGLAPEHLHEWPPLGVAFVASAAAAALAVVGLVLRPASPWPPLGLGVLLGGLVVAYALTRLAALPPLAPEREPLDLVGVCTCAAEALGVVAALLLRRRTLVLTPGGTA